MPVQRKQQVLAKIETSEGLAATLSASDAAQIFDPALGNTTDVQDRAPAGPTLSRDFAPVGRQTRSLSFRSDFRGSGDTSIPVTEPDWGKFAQACGFKAGTLRRLTCGAVTGTGFQLGEICSQSAGAIRGVVVAITRAGAPLQRATASGDIVVLAAIVGTLTAAATTGESSGSTSTASAAAAHEGLVYQPTSEKLVNVTTSTWTGTPPAAVGEVLLVENPTGTPVGMVQIITDNGSFEDLDVTLLQGVMLDTYTLRSAGDGTATISGEPTQVRTPSLTIRHNLDGRQRDLLGARGDFSLEGEVAQPMQFAWNFSGDLGPSIDAPAIATTGLSTIRPPRLLGAICTYGIGEHTHRIATKRVALAMQGTVSPNLDANRAGGSTGSNVVDRNPVFNITVDQVHGGFDWEAALAAGTVVRVAMLIGSTAGNMLAITAPICQVVEVSLGESDGIATFDLTIAPRRIRESGDDDLYIAQV